MAISQTALIMLKDWCPWRDSNPHPTRRPCKLEWGTAAPKAEVSTVSPQGLVGWRIRKELNLRPAVATRLLYPTELRMHADSRVICLQADHSAVYATTQLWNWTALRYAAALSSSATANHWPSSFRIKTEVFKRWRAVRTVRSFRGEPALAAASTISNPRRPGVCWTIRKTISLAGESKSTSAGGGAGSGFSVVIAEKRRTAASHPALNPVSYPIENRARSCAAIAV